MKNSAPDVQREEELKSACQSAKKAKKKAKATYKAKLKELKSKMKPYKQSLRTAEKAEKQAKSAYKALENKENNGIGHALEAPAAKFATTSEELQQKKRGRQPGYSPKAAKAATEAPAKTPAKRGRQPKAIVAEAAQKRGISYPTLIRGRQPKAIVAEAAAPAKPGRAKAAAGGGDDLTKVRGVGENIAVMLKANGIRTFADMAATSFQRYKELLKANGMSKFREPSPWAARAAELANLPAPAPAQKPAPKAVGAPAKRGRKPAGKVVVNHEEQKVPKKRGRQPGYSPKAAKAATEAPAKTPAKRGRQPKAIVAEAAQKRGISYPTLQRFRQPKAIVAKAAAPAKPGRAKAAAAGGGDDLTKVRGVGENIAVMLKANGIRTFADMAATSFQRYKELLKANGMSKFREPSPWAARAAELANLPAPAPVQKTAAKAAKAPAKPGPKPKAMKVVVNHEEMAVPKKRGRQPGYSPKAAKAAAEAPAKTPAKPGRQPKPAVAKATAPAKPGRAKAAPAGGGDDLTKVKGVGENIAVMLKANGIRTFADMANTSFERYKELLKANGMSKFREPSPWAARAAELANLPAPAPAQKPAPKAAEAPAKRNRQAKTVIDESLMKSRTKPQAAKTKAPAAAPKAAPANPDDLTLVKGVGGRVAEALNREGIYTFAEMAATNLERYREILRANDMSKFRDPSDWAQLAGELVKTKK